MHQYFDIDTRYPRSLIYPYTLDLEKAFIGLVIYDTNITLVF